MSKLLAQWEAEAKEIVMGPDGYDYNLSSAEFCTRLLSLIQLLRKKDEIFAGMIDRSNAATPTGKAAREALALTEELK